MPIDHFDHPCAFFAVYDGFRGLQCVDFISKQFHTRLLKKLSANTDAASWTDEAVSECLKGVFEEIDGDFLAKFRTANDGATVVVVLVLGVRVFVAWLGNCRCFICNRDADGVPSVALTTENHTPSDAEAERIKEAGGVIVDMGDGFPRLAHPGFDERIRELRRAEAQGMGVIGKVPNSLAVSRAMGDREFKAVTGKALLIATPGVKCFRLEPSSKLIAVTCGGVSDVMTDEDVMKELLVVRDRSSAAANVRAACGAVVSEAYKRGSTENLTIILAALEWEGINVFHAFRPRGLKREEAPVPVDTAATASKKRRLAAAAVVTAQKREAHDRAVAAESAAPEASKKQNGSRSTPQPAPAAAKPAAPPAAAAANAAGASAATPVPKAGAAAAEAPKATSTAGGKDGAVDTSSAASNGDAPTAEVGQAASGQEAAAPAAAPKPAAKPEGKAKKRILV
mmetsp:Transcript_39053/g.71104  ORF Transcript_39053/g.71104 Transcript_39053/m.71104 type:complete len:454 (+) Transcript_39053:55-1416(+)